MAVIITLEFLFLPKRIFKEPTIWYKFVVSITASMGGIFFLDPYVHTRFFNEGYVGHFMAHPVDEQ